MSRPLGVTILAAVFMAQAMYVLARAIERRESLPPPALAAALAAVALQVLTAAGLLRMRKWGRSLAVAMCGLAAVVGLWMRAAGAPHSLVLPLVLVAAGIIVYLVASPARSHFT